jgi:hypothetical protein
LLVVAADDAKNVVLLATVAIAAVVLLVKDLATSVHALGSVWSHVAVAAASILVLAATILYTYSAMINQRRMELVRCLASNDALHARDLWAGETKGIAAQRGWLLRLGTGLLVLGLAWRSSSLGSS